MFSCMIFDVDGTILDTKKASLLAAQATIEQTLHKHYALAELEESFFTTTKVFAQSIGYDDPSVYMNAIKKNYEEYGNKYNSVFDGIRETLEQLQAMVISLGVATAKTRWEYDHDFDRFGLAHFFPCAMTADDTAHPKPAPDPLNKYAELMKIDKKDMLFIGDMPTDYACASSAGVSFAFAGWSGNTPLDGTHYFLQAPHDLLALAVEG